jgi:hypothetical protein
MTVAEPSDFAEPTLWVPQVGPQEFSINMADLIFELLFGGARGGGKSSFLLGDFVQDIGQGALWVGILFRRSIPELDELIAQSMALYPAYGGEYKRARNEWHFPSGALLRLRHMEDLNDFVKYQGHALSWLGFDELGNWPNLVAYKAMLSTVRGPARRKRIRATANPGGEGHLALKEYFGIAPHPQGYVRLASEKTRTTRMYVPSRIQDNKILLADDPDYEARLYASGDEELVRAWVDGDWDAIVGAYFSMWNAAHHVVDPYPIDPSWPLYAGLDYGETNPTVLVLGAVDFDDNLVIFGEYFASNRGAADHARAVKAAIDANPWAHKRTPGLTFADPSMWTKRRTDEAALARSPADTFATHRVHLTKANNDRVNGWRVLMDAMRHRRLRFFRGYTKHTVEAIPTMQRDPLNPEDMIKGGNDHCLDALRYMAIHVYKPRAVQKVVRKEFQADAILAQLRGLRNG